MPQSFPADLRIAQDVATLAGADNSLESINTAKLSNRALVAVEENNSIYMLRKESVASPSSPDIIAPAQGGPGRWYLYSPGASGAVLSAPVTLSYHEATSGRLTRLPGVAVAGIAEGDLAWCSPSGPTDTLGVIGGVVACYVVADGQVDIIGELFSLDALPTTVTQPATVFWVRP